MVSVSCCPCSAARLAGPWARSPSINPKKPRPRLFIVVAPAPNTSTMGLNDSAGPFGFCKRKGPGSCLPGPSYLRCDRSGRSAAAADLQRVLDVLHAFDVRRHLRGTRARLGVIHEA